MRKLITTLGTVTAVLLASAVFLWGEPVDVLSNKVLLEAQMEGRLKQVISSYLGTNDVTVVVRLVLADKSASGTALRSWDENKDIVLPGVPAATSMTQKSLSDEGRKVLAKLGLSRIDATVYVGKKLGSDLQEKVRQLAIRTLGLDLDHGDALSIESYTPPAAGLTGAVSPREIVTLAALAAFIFFLFGPMKSFLRRFNENLTVIVSRQTAKSYEKKEGEDEEETGSSGAAKGSGAAVPADVPLPADEYTDRSPSIEEEKLTLGRYINKNNLEDLKLVLQSETPEVIARVIQRLPPRTALAAIPKDKANEVIAQFIRTEFENPEMVKMIMDRIKDKMLGSFGGPVKLARILQQMDKGSQENMLRLLKIQDVTFAESVENRLFHFEDILGYEEANLRRIFRKAGTEAFARCLKACPEETEKAFYEKLGPAITNLITSRMKTLIVSGQDNESEVAVLQAIEELGRKGVIRSLDEIKQQQRP